MKLERCTRCNQPRTSAQLWRGICEGCRRHRCTRHPEGSATCYSRCHCRCPGCRKAAATHSKRCRHDKASGRPHRIDSAPVVAHLEMLLASGMSKAEMAERTGIHRSGLVRLLRGDQPGIRPDLAERALAVMPAPITEAAAGEVDACGVRRRLQALVALGWSHKRLADMMGIRGGTVSRWLTADRCFASSRLKVVQLYESLWTQQAPPNVGRSDSRARNTARRNGWVPPMAWDDGTGPHGIDNPDATPWGGSTRQTMRAAELADEVTRMLGSDSGDGIARRLGYADLDALASILARTGRKDLSDRLRAARIVFIKSEAAA